MLTHRSSTASKTKMLVFMPLAMVCVICFSQTSFSQRPERNGNKVTWRGNVFELSNPSTDTMTLVDPVTGNELTKYVLHGPEVKTMNGQPLVWAADEDLKFTGSEKNLRDYLLRNMKDELSRLQDGVYTLNISNVLIDDHGRIVYFDYKEMQRSNPNYKPANNSAAPVIVNAGDPEITVKIDHNPKVTAANPVVMVGNNVQLHYTNLPRAAQKDKMNAVKQANIENGNNATEPKSRTMTLRRNTDPDAHLPIDSKNQQEIYDKVCRLMEVAPGFIPATYEGKNVVAKYPDDIYFINSFKMQDHKVYEMTRSGKWEELK